MKSNKWEVIKGASNLGEDDIRVAGFKVESDGVCTGVTKIAYCAYGGLKVLELRGVPDFEVEDKPYGECEALRFEEYLDGKDWEVGFFVKMYGCGGGILVSINDCEMFEVDCQATTSGSDVNLEHITQDELEVISVEEYMVDDYEELDLELLKIFSYI